MVHGDTIVGNQLDGIMIWWSFTTITDCVIEDNQRMGVAIGNHPLSRKNAQYALASDSIIIERCTIRNNPGNGIGRLESKVRVTRCQFGGNVPYGIENGADDHDIDARLNCWGHPTGPGGVGPGLGDAVSDHVLYDPWLANGVRIAGSTRTDPTAANNARKVIRDECPPYYKVFYTAGSGVWVIMTSDPVNGPWLEPVEIWPVDMIHHSNHPAAAIEKNDHAGAHPYSRIHLVWAEHIPDEAAPGEIYYSWSDDGGMRWQPPANLSNSDSPSEHPSIAVDGLDVVHVVWEEHATFSPEILYTNNSVDGWTGPLNISHSSLASTYPAAAGNYKYYYADVPPYVPDDRVHIAWTEFEPRPSGGEVPYIAYRSFDPSWNWIPELDSLPEDATQGMGGAFTSIIAYPSSFEVGRAPAVVWQWPYYAEEPPASASDIYFNERTSGAWGLPRNISSWEPDPNPSRYASITMEHETSDRRLRAVWEEWNQPIPGRSEIFSSVSTDLGATWDFYLNLSQTHWDFSVHPGLAYQKGVTFEGLYDLCWTEIEVYGDPDGEDAFQEASYVHYIGATSLEDSIYAGVPVPEVMETPSLLATCLPNPVSDEARFVVTVREAAQIEIAIFDIRGRLVKRLAATTESGTQAITWNGRDSTGQAAASGVYCYKLSSSEAVVTGKVVVLR